MHLCERNGSEQTYSNDVLYLEQDTSQEDITTSDSGFWYERPRLGAVIDPRTTDFR